MVDQVKITLQFLEPVLVIVDGLRAVVAVAQITLLVQEVKGSETVVLDF